MCLNGSFCRCPASPVAPGCTEAGPESARLDIPSGWYACCIKQRFRPALSGPFYLRIQCEYACRPVRKGCRRRSAAAFLLRNDLPEFDPQIRLQMYDKESGFPVRQRLNGRFVHYKISEIKCCDKYLKKTNLKRKYAHKVNHILQFYCNISLMEDQ